MTPKCENEKQFERPCGLKKCPEAGQPLLYQHNGAGPHTAKINTRGFVGQGKSKAFDIKVFVQPAESPDLNVDELVFFHSL